MKLSAQPKRAKSANSGVTRDRDRDRPTTAVKSSAVPSSSYYREEFTNTNNSSYSYPENNSRSRSPPREASLNGSFASNISNEMLEVKINRKRAESDLQLLANRIALLRLEEQRAMNKVTETKMRAQEILEIKRRNDEVTQMKLALSLNKDLHVRAAQEKAAEDREERIRKVNMSRKMTYDYKKSNAEQKKQESRQLEEIKSKGRELSEQEKRQRVEEEKRRQEYLKVQRDRERMEREQRAQQLYQQRMEEENQRRREAEEMILLLENEEKDLILRLKRSQDLQQQVGVYDLAAVSGILSTSISCNASVRSSVGASDAFPLYFCSLLC
eukprot:gene25704-33566_t